MSTGIISYGTAFPKHRIRSVEINKVWNNMHPSTMQKMGFEERAVCYPDQDAVTLAVDAAEIALERWGDNRDKISALIFGSGTSPYASKAASTVIADALGLRKDILSFDLQFAGKSGTSAMITAKAFVDSGKAEYVLVIGADTINLHISPGHMLEAGASAGAAAFLIGKKDVIAEIGDTLSYQQDQTDYFRTEGERFYQVGCGIIGYISHWGLSDNVVPAGKLFFKKNDLCGDDFYACALQSNSFIMPMMISGPLKLNVADSVLSYILTPFIGNIGAASALVTLAYILDEGETDEKVLAIAYGEGAGCDILEINTTKMLKEYDNSENSVIDQFTDKIYVDYPTALKYERKLIRPDNIIHGFI